MHDRVLQAGITSNVPAMVASIRALAADEVDPPTFATMVGAGQEDALKQAIKEALADCSPLRQASVYSYLSAASTGVRNTREKTAVNACERWDVTYVNVVMFPTLWQASKASCRSLHDMCLYFNVSLAGACSKSVTFGFVCI